MGLRLCISSKDIILGVVARKCISHIRPSVHAVAGVNRHPGIERNITFDTCEFDSIVIFTAGGCDDAAVNRNSAVVTVTVDACGLAASSRDSAAVDRNRAARAAITTVTDAG